MADPMANGVAYLEFPPGPLLADYVQCFWTIRGAYPDGSRALNRVLPDGCLDLVFNLGDSYTSVDPSDPSADFGVPRGIVSGPMTRPRVMWLAGRIEIFGVRFKPGAARPFLNLALDDLIDLPVPLPDLWKGYRGELEEQLFELHHFRSRIELLERALLGRLERGKPVDRTVIGAIETICQSKGQIQIADVEDQAGISGRQLERRFREHTGLTPKLFCRVLRFQEAVGMLFPHITEPQWADFACGAGFYDQAHFIREFKALSGITPAGYMRERRMSDFYNTHP